MLAARLSRDVLNMLGRDARVAFERGVKREDKGTVKLQCKIRRHFRKTKDRRDSRLSRIMTAHYARDMA